MNVLIVGAGPVGKTYGKILDQAQVEVSFLVKEKYAAAAKPGFRLYPVNQGRNKIEIWKHYQVYSEIAALRNREFDYVIFSMSSTALRGDWLDELLKTIRRATLVILQPGAHDYEYVSQKVSSLKLPHLLIDGTIPIVSYEAPLPGENREPGTVIWIPPGAHIAMSGPEHVTEPLIEKFKKGGINAKKVEDVRKENTIAGPVLTVLVQALKRESWSFHQLKTSSTLQLACKAMREAVLIQATRTQSRIPPVLWALHPFLIRLLLSFSTRVVPFDFETYMKVHFTKVGEQMSKAIDDYIASGRQQNQSTSALEELKNQPKHS